MTRAAALLALLAGAARAAVETHEVHASGSFGLLRRKHVNPERRLQTDYAPSAAPSEAPTFETWMPTAVGEDRLVRDVQRAEVELGLVRRHRRSVFQER